MSGVTKICSKYNFVLLYNSIPINFTSISFYRYNAITIHLDTIYLITILIHLEYLFFLWGGQKRMMEAPFLRFYSIFTTAFTSSPWMVTHPSANLGPSCLTYVIYGNWCFQLGIAVALCLPQELILEAPFLHSWDFTVQYFSQQHPLQHIEWTPINHGPSCLASVILWELVFPT